MNTSYKQSIALIGCGDWGKNIARTLEKMGALASITDDSEKAREIAHALQVPLYSLEEVLKSSSLKGAVIATPTPTHVSLAQQILQNGKSVLVEKPLAVKKEEISLLQTLADQKGLTLMAGHLLIYHKAFQMLVQMVQSGTLGKILTIETTRKNLGKVHAHEGVLWDLGPHDFSMILTLMGGLPDQVLSHSESYVYPGKPDIQTILLHYKEGPMVQIGLSRLHPVKEQKVTVVGTTGSAVFDDTKEWAEKLVFYPHQIVPQSSLLQRGAPEGISILSSEPLREELTHFIECIQTHQKPLSSARQAHQVLTLIQAVEEADHKKTWISVSEKG